MTWRTGWFLYTSKRCLRRGEGNYSDILRIHLSILTVAIPVVTIEQASVFPSSDWTCSYYGQIWTMLELPPIEQIEFFPSSLHLSVSTECLHPCHMGKVQGVCKHIYFNLGLTDNILPLCRCLVNNIWNRCTHLHYKLSLLMLSNGKLPVEIVMK
jgi:hypothetical protein